MQTTTHNETSTSALANKALLAYLNISAWNGRKFDRDASTELTRNKHADADVARVNKVLIDKTGFQDLTRIKNNARAIHYAYTTPWLDDSGRLLKAQTSMEYMQLMGQLEREYNQAADAFELRYVDMVTAQLIRLGDMGNPEDYPDASEVRSKFDFRVSIMPMPNLQDWRVDVGEDEFKLLYDKAANDIERRLQASQKDLWLRLYTRVKDLYTNMTKEGTRRDGAPVYRNSTFTNIKDVIDLIPAVQIQDDPDLDRIRREIDQRLLTIDPQSTRESDLLRKAVADDASDILDKMGAYI